MILQKFYEFPNGTNRQVEKARKNGTREVYFINAEQVGMILPRDDYTTVLVQGMWIHLDHPFDEVVSKLGWEAKQ